MRRRSGLSPVLFTLVSIFVIAAARPAAATPGVVSCQQFAAALRHGTYPFRGLMQQSSAVFQDAGSGLGIRYLAVQPTPGATAYPTVVFFNGTAQISPDWPAQLLVSSSSALCNHAALVFFDYPGIGGTAYPGDAAFTFDKVSETVYDLLEELKQGSSLKVSVVDPAGWSLGTAAAVKFGTLAGHNQAFKASGMSIGSFLLIAVKAGGDLHSAASVTPQSCGAIKSAPVSGWERDAEAAEGGAPAAESTPAEADAGKGTTYYPATGGQAMCATSVLTQLLDRTVYEGGAEIKDEFARLTFPYVFAATGQPQAPYGAGAPPTVCATTLSGVTVDALCNLQKAVPIETQCAASATSECSTTQALFGANREQAPYLDGISFDAYYGEREMIFSFDYASCSSASATAWQSTACLFNPLQTGSPLYSAQRAVDGSPCQMVLTTSANASPAIQACPGLSSALRAQGTRFYVWNGQEDLLVRPDYGQVMCTWLSGHGFPCTYTSLPDAGHGVLYTWATRMYGQLAAAIAASAAR